MALNPHRVFFFFFYWKGKACFDGGKLSSGSRREGILTLRPGCDWGWGPLSDTQALLRPPANFPCSSWAFGLLEWEARGGQAAAPEALVGISRPDSLARDEFGALPPGTGGQRRSCPDLRAPGALLPQSSGCSSCIPDSARVSGAGSGALCSAAPAWRSPDQTGSRVRGINFVFRAPPLSLGAWKDWVGRRTQTPLPGRTLSWPGRLKQRQLGRYKALKSVFWNFFGGWGGVRAVNPWKSLRTDSGK